MTFDFEPEDAYDASDPPHVIARNLARRLELLASSLAARGGVFGPRERLRLEQLAADIDTLRRRR